MRPGSSRRWSWNSVGVRRWSCSRRYAPRRWLPGRRGAERREMRERLSHFERWQVILGLIAAAAAVATIVGTMSSILIRSSGPPTPSTPSSARSAGPVTPATLNPMTTPLQPSASSPAVLYTGKRDLAATYAADLDNPTWAVAPVSRQPAGADIYFDASGNLSRYNGEWGVLRSHGGNGYQECAGFTAFAASLVPVSGLGAGTRLCVRTSEGRIGLLIVRGVSGRDFTAIMSFDVTIWD
jgi:hypothetical protein